MSSRTLASEFNATWFATRAKLRRMISHITEVEYWVSQFMYAAAEKVQKGL